MRKGAGGSGGAKVAGQVGGDAPTFGCDFHCLALGVVKIEEHTWNKLWTKLTGTGCDAACDGWSGAGAGLLRWELDSSFERLDHIADGGGPGDDGMLGLKAGEQPVAIDLGLERDDLVAFELDGDASEDLAEVGGKGRGGAGGG